MRRPLPSIGAPAVSGPTPCAWVNARFVPCPPPWATLAEVEVQVEAAVPAGVEAQAGAAEAQVEVAVLAEVAVPAAAIQAEAQTGAVVMLVAAEVRAVAAEIQAGAAALVGEEVPALAVVPAGAAVQVAARAVVLAGSGESPPAVPLAPSGKSTTRGPARSGASWTEAAHAGREVAARQLNLVGAVSGASLSSTRCLVLPDRLAGPAHTRLRSFNVDRRCPTGRRA
jgi:hypothetical protein